MLSASAAAKAGTRTVVTSTRHASSSGHRCASFLHRQAWAGGRLLAESCSLAKDHLAKSRLGKNPLPLEEDLLAEGPTACRAPRLETLAEAGQTLAMGRHMQPLLRVLENASSPGRRRYATSPSYQDGAERAGRQPVSPSCTDPHSRRTYRGGSHKRGRGGEHIKKGRYGHTHGQFFFFPWVEVDGDGDGGGMLQRTRAANIIHCSDGSGATADNLLLGRPARPSSPMRRLRA